MVVYKSAFGKTVPDFIGLASPFNTMRENIPPTPGYVPLTDPTVLAGTPVISLHTADA
jgi:hypothetical protein